jgi:DASS family divalent anion:Na+ symporter
MSALSIKRLLIFSLGLLIWFAPTPIGLTPQAWHLFAIFITTIGFVIVDALPIFVASIIALSIAVFTQTLTPKEAFSGFSESFILLIMVAFLLAKGVINSGLGKRVAFMIIKRFGSSTLGLAYSTMLADILIAPAFPSNTARSGVLFPILNALCIDSNSKVEDGTHRKIGSFLMFSSMAGLTLSSSLWLTAMAANPTGVAIAKKMGVNIDYGMWVLGAIFPVLVLFILIPLVLYIIFPPQIKKTPNAPIIAKSELEKMGKFSKNEWIMSIIFISILFLWIMSESWGLDKTVVALFGLAMLMLGNIFTLNNLKEEGGALEILIWFAILYTLSVYLGKFGFMAWLGEIIAGGVGGQSWQMVYLILVVAYVLIHYFFVSQTAHMLALFSIFLEVGMRFGVDGELMALMLLYATNFNAILTPQGSSANVIYIGSGYITPNEVYKFGGIITLLNTFIFLTIGTVWILWVI